MSKEMNVTIVYYASFIFFGKAIKRVAPKIIFHVALTPIIHLVLNTMFSSAMV
jgi:hypothetical protein